MMGMRRAFWAVMAWALMCYACSDGTPEDGGVSAEKPYVLTLLCSPGGLGDNGYNDNIFEGVARFVDAHADEVEFHLRTPSSLDEAQEEYEAWLSLPAEEGRNSLMVLAGSDFMAFPDGGSPADGRKVLLFETQRTDFPEGVYTFNLSMYGVSYWAGSLVGMDGRDVPWADSTLVLAAMPGDPVLEEAIQGYSDGFCDHGGDFCRVVYLADGYQGFSMPDSAFRVMSRLGDDGYTMVYPLLGGSADGVYRYTREVYWTPTIGMDVDCSGVSDGVLFSVVREMDEAMEAYLEQWLAGEVWPARQTFGLSSGWTDIVLAPRLSGSRWQTWLEACRTEAWAKEEEYYEALSLD